MDSSSDTRSYKEIDHCKKISEFLFLIFGISLPFSVALTFFCMGSIFILSIIRGFKFGWSRILKVTPIATFCLGWLSLHLVGIFWAEDTYTALIITKKAAYFALIPIFMGLISHGILKKSLAAYVVGIFTYHLILHFMHLGWIEFDYLQVGGTPFIARIHYSPLLLLAILILIHYHKNWTSTKSRFINFVVICSMIVSLITIEGRSGQILFALLLPIWILLETRNWKYFLSVLFLLTMTTIFLFSQLDSLRHRYTQIESQWDHFKEGDIYSSMGQRFHHINVSWQSFKQSPLVGHGTGSYKSQHDKVWPDYIKGRINYNPHNQFLMSAVQFGGIGLGYMLLLFVILLQSSAKFPHHPFKPLLILIPIMFFFLCFVDTHLYGVPSLTTFIYLTSILYHPDWSMTETQ